MNSSELKILILEDVPTDAELMEKELRKGGIVFTTRRVDARDDFVKGLDEFAPDLILADYKLPAFDGLSALEIAREKSPNVPFIFVTGVMGEELAVETLKRGATDYVLKTKLFKLVPAVQRALEIAAERSRLREAEENLRESEERFRSVAETAADAIICLKERDTAYFWNKKAEEVFGYTAAEAIGKQLHQLIVPEKYREKASKGLKTFYQTGTGSLVGKVIEFTALRRDGTEFPVELSVSAMNIGGKWQATGIIRDITERKRAEEERSRLVGIIEATTDFVGFADAVDTHISYINPAGRRMVGIGADEDVTKLKIADVHPAGTNKLFAEVALPAAVREGVWSGECAFLNRDGREIPVLMVLVSHKDATGRVDIFSTISRDITERKKAEETLKQRLDELTRFEKATIQREFRMRELKEENERLKERIGEMEGKKSS